MDIVSADQDGPGVTLLPGIGGGTFGPKTDYSTGWSPRSVEAADFNNDGYLDLAVANQSDNSITVSRFSSWAW